MPATGTGALPRAGLALALAALVLAGGPAAGGLELSSGPCGGPGCLLWTTLHADGGHVGAHRLALAPDGSRAFALRGDWDPRVVAFDGHTGAVQWTAPLPGPVPSLHLGWSPALVPSPSGRVLYVAMPSSLGPDPASHDFHVTALDASGGQVLWQRFFPDLGRAMNPVLLASPDGSRLVLAGHGVPYPASHHSDARVLALDAATGLPAWSATYASPDGQDDAFEWGALSRDGQRLYLGGIANRSALVAAYHAPTGAPAWTHVSEPPAWGYRHPSEGALSPDGSRLYVADTELDRLNLTAFDAASGAVAWWRKPGFHNASFVHGLAVSPAGDRVVAAATGHASGSGIDWVVLAFAGDGALAWSHVHHGPAFGSYDDLGGVALSPDGALAYVAGSTEVLSGGWPQASNLTVKAFDVATGALAWATVTGEAVDLLANVGIAVSPEGGRLVTSSAASGAAWGDHLAAAFQGQALTPPGAPRALAATPTGLQTSAVALAWQAPADDGGSPRTAYKVYKGTHAGNLALRATVGPGVHGLVDAGVPVNQVAHYAVSAVSALGEGPMSTHACARGTGLVPTGPLDCL